MNQGQLVLRDPALAALVGAIGPNFGHEVDFGTEFAGDFNGDFGDDWGDDWGADPGSTAAAAAAARAAAAAQSSGLAKFRAQQAISQHRRSILHPNRGSDVDVERYVFTLGETITLGTASSFTMSDSPDTKIRPQRITSNAPCPMFAFISSIRVANVVVTVGTAEEDAYNYASVGVASSLDLPTLSPQNKAKVSARYTGYLPPGYVDDTEVTFNMSFRGPATMAAG